MKLLSYGISGEETVAFELNNSFMPNTIDEMMGVSGFGEAKCAKYGEDILGVLEKFR